MSRKDDAFLANAYGTPIKGNTTRISVPVTTSTVEQELSSKTMYRIYTDTDIHFCFTISGQTADTDEGVLVEDAVEYFSTDETNVWFSATALTASGLVYLTEVTPKGFLGL